MKMFPFILSAIVLLPICEHGEFSSKKSGDLRPPSSPHENSNGFLPNEKLSMESRGKFPLSLGKFHAKATIDISYTLY
jgi:hypothetical protein